MAETHTGTPAPTARPSLALRLARNEFRGPKSGFVVLFLCLLLGVAMIATVGSVSTAVNSGLRSEGQRLLGGDVELRLTQRPASPAEWDAIAMAGTVSHVTEMRAIVRTPEKSTPDESTSDKSALAEVKAVDSLYPLYHSLSVEPYQDRVDVTAESDGAWPAYSDPILAQRLGLTVGGRLRLGQADLVLRGLITREPDHATNLFSLGPRLLISHDALAASGLLRPGALTRHLYRIRFEDARDPQAWLDTLQEEFPEAGWRIRQPENAAPGVERFVKPLGIFLTLTGLTALLVGGIGIANAVRAYINSRARTIAIFKCIGAPPNLVPQVYALQLFIIALMAILSGVTIGAGAGWAITDALGRVAPIEVESNLYPVPLAIAAAFGFLAAATFATWPLAAIRDVKASHLFRATVTAQVTRMRTAPVAVTGVCILGLVALTLMVVADTLPAFWFIAGTSLAFAFLWATGRAIIVAVRRGRRRLMSFFPARPALRLALANLARPGAPPMGVFLSLGIGFSALVAIAAVDNTLDRLVAERVSDSAPTFFFIDVRPDQTQALETLMNGIEGVLSYEGTKVIQGRITAINGVKAEEAQITPGSRWALRGDRVFTTAATVPANAEITDGTWWPPDYQGETLISLDAGLAQGFGIGVGDTLTLNILGRNIQGRIANLRRIDWSQLNLDFALILSPGPIDQAPQNYLYAVRTTPEDEVTLSAAITSRFDNIASVRVRDAVESATRMLNNISVAARVATLATLCSGLLVLAGTIIAIQAQTLRETAVFKVLGATKQQLWRAYLLEYGLLGLLAAILSTILGTLGGWGIVTTVMGLTWAAAPLSPSLAALGCTLLTLSTGAMVTGRIYRQRASLSLRNE